MYVVYMGRDVMILMRAARSLQGQGQGRGHWKGWAVKNKPFWVLCSVFCSECCDFYVHEFQGASRNSYLCTYDLYGSVHNVFDAFRSITRASGRGLGPGNREFFGPSEMASSR